MNAIEQFLSKYDKPLFILLFAFCLLPFVSPAIALFLGLAFAMTAGQPFPKFSKKTSKYLLQFSVVGLGFGMNLYESLQTGKDGMIFTIVSVVSVLALGMYLGKRLMMDKKTAYLIASGTAICGGSAIAAVGPVVKANGHVLTPRQYDGLYLLSDIQSHQDITIEGIVKDCAVGIDPAVNTQAKAYATGHTLYIYTPKEETVHILRFNGVPLKALRISGDARVTDLPHGAYIVKIGNLTFKVML